MSKWHRKIIRTCGYKNALYEQENTKDTNIVATSKQCMKRNSVHRITIYAVKAALTMQLEK